MLTELDLIPVLLRGSWELRQTGLQHLLSGCGLLIGPIWVGRAVWEEGMGGKWVCSCDRSLLPTGSYPTSCEQETSCRLGRRQSLGSRVRGFTLQGMLRWGQTGLCSKSGHVSLKFPLPVGWGRKVSESRVLLVGSFFMHCFVGECDTVVAPVN